MHEHTAGSTLHDGSLSGKKGENAEEGTPGRRPAQWVCPDSGTP
ncbi:hypothetical protein DVDV_4335 [Desulfovibrio sp. DV]|nr:hypothetical protein DVDV_4335 [Desulfovibrio sp. DV]